MSSWFYRESYEADPECTPPGPGPAGPDTGRRGIRPRENFIAALEGVGTLDVGDFRVEYGPGNHNGSSFVELEMYTAAGSLIR